MRTQKAFHHKPERTETVLTLQLRRKWFDLVAMGYKNVEFRTVNEYWQSRIEKKTYSHILFRNGYGEQRPGMLVEYQGWSKDKHNTYYALSLGAVRRIWNYTLPRIHKAYAASECACDWLRPWYDKLNSAWFPTFRLPMHNHTDSARKETLPLDTPVRSEGQISIEPMWTLDASASEVVNAFLKKEGLVVDTPPDPSGSDAESTDDDDYVILASSS